ncbi:MAG: hypothetical protein RLY21_183 [Planctomycetota bacterium]|jgi:hypothetical protein
MQTRPSDPTSALAALIAGNHRHIDRLASGGARWSDDSARESHAFPQKPFALALCEPGVTPMAPHVFSLDHREVIVVDAIRDAVMLAEAHPLKLIVAVQPIPSQLAQVSSAWVHAELRSFSTIEAILRESPAVRRAVAANSMRIVAALLEQPAERVHWVGEHPEIELLLQDA